MCQIGDFPVIVGRKRHHTAVSLAKGFRKPSASSYHMFRCPNSPVFLVLVDREHPSAAVSLVRSFRKPVGSSFHMLRCLNLPGFLI